MQSPLEIFISLSLITLATCIPPGPFTLIMIQYGRVKNPIAAAIYIAGIFVSDLTASLLFYFGLGKYFNHPLFQMIITFGGAIFLVWMGYMLMQSGAKTAEPSADGASSEISLVGPHPLVNGLMVTMMNPVYWIWWGSVGLMYLFRGIEAGVTGIFAFASGLIVPTIVWFSLVYFAVVKGSKWISEKTYRVINLVSGIIIIVFGIWFAVQGILKIVSPVS